MNGYLSRPQPATHNPQFSAKTLLVSLIAAAGLSGCAGTPIVTAMPNSCASLLPQEWRVPVAGAPLPDGDTVGDWVSFADQQTGKLDIANDRTLSAIGIVERCEQRDVAAVKKATRSWLGRLFG